MADLVIIAHNIRSTHNVGAILRTAEGFGVKRCYLSGYTPYPRIPDDSRLPHLADKIDKAITKTALGAQKLVPLSVVSDVHACIAQLSSEGYSIVGLEQAGHSTLLQDFMPTGKVALLLGEEVNGISPDLVELCNEIVEIPMVGKKESFNVSVAAGIAMYELTRQK